MMKLTEAFPNWLVGDGIFSELSKLSVPWSTNSIDLDLEYFGNHSGDKIISPLVSKLLVNDKLTSDSITRLASIIFSLNGDNWSRLYSALQEEYKALQNYNGDETRTVTTTDTGTDTFSHTGNETNTLNDSSSNTRTGSESLESSGSDSLSKTGTVGSQGSNSSDNNVFGFNSSSSVPSDSSNSSNNSTDTYNLSDKTSYGKKDTKVYNNVSDSGSRESTNTVSNESSDTETKNLQTNTSETFHREGNLGVTTSQQMLESEFELRMHYRFFDVVFADVDKTLALQLY